MTKIKLDLTLRKRRRYKELERKAKLNAFIEMKHVLPKVNRFLNSYGVALKNDCLQIMSPVVDFDPEKPSITVLDVEQDFLKYQEI